MNNRMNNRIYPKDIFFREIKKIERRKNLVVRQLLIEKKNKYIELNDVLQRMIELRKNKYIELNGVLQRMIELSIR